MKQETTSHTLVSGFTESVRRFPSRNALVVSGRTLTYERLGRTSSRLAAAIKRDPTGDNPLVALLAYRSEAAYAGVLGILLAGKGYVPLSPAFPVDRLKRMFLLSCCDLIIVGREGFQRLRELLPRLSRPIGVIVPERSDAKQLSGEFPQHRFVACDDLTGGEGHVFEASEVAPESVAYLLFTSGSTGQPKGVAVSHQNVTSYIHYVCDRYGVNEHDRVSQHFDMTFDLSVHDMFVCWQRGACLCVVPEKALMAPAKFIKDQELTMWFSVPSAMAFMQRVGMLKPGAFPSLRCSLFCGEPLPAEYARAWQEASPNSFVENLYGPTEATIAITCYRWDPDESPEACVNGIVPIGWPFDGQRACIIDAEGSLIAVGESGELALGGSQVTGGYWNDPEKSRERFVPLPAVGDGVWYLTSDVARQGEDGCLYYLGRSDDQVKIRGYRVELQEVDHAVRSAAGTQEAVTVAWPSAFASAEGVVAFVCVKDRGDEDSLAREIVGHCKTLLPDYMVPRTVYFVDDFPLNVSGKIDRKRLFQMLEEGAL